MAQLLRRIRKIHATDHTSNTPIATPGDVDSPKAKNGGDVTRARNGCDARADSRLRLMILRMAGEGVESVTRARASTAHDQAHYFLHFARNPGDFGKELPLGGCIDPRLEFNTQRSHLGV
jgi:hypothetical protein